MEQLIEYFTDMFHLDKHVAPPASVVTRINALDRAERGELKSRLFTLAKRLGCGGDGLRAIRWLESTFDLIEKNSFRLHEVLFSPGQDIPENIAFYMSQARKTIDLCVFTISDDTLSGCLKAMKSKGVKVRIITDNNKMRDHGSQIKELARCGIEVKVDNSRYHMHNKFGIIDGRIAFTGSYNWTYTAKEHNQENLVITTNFTIVHRFINEFEELWDKMFRLHVKQQRDGQVSFRVDSPAKSDRRDSDRQSPAWDDANATSRSKWQRDKDFDGAQGRAQGRTQGQAQGRGNERQKGKPGESSNGNARHDEGRRRNNALPEDEAFAGFRFRNRKAKKSDRNRRNK